MGVALGLILMVVTIDRPAMVEGAINCGTVQSLLTSCVKYVKTSIKPARASSCCNGVKGVVNLTKSRADRQQACACVTRLARSVRKINYRSVASLPGSCGVRIPFTISSSTNCNK